MNEISKPNKRTFWKLSNDDNTIIHEGYTDINQVTSSALNNIVQDTNANTVYPQLPSSGTLTEGERYAFQGDLVEVRQTHERTLFDPNETPALFSVFRANTEGANWIPNEDVIIGDTREFEGRTYQCIQSHFTLDIWTPPTVPALWQVVPEESVPGGEWSTGIIYSVDDEVTYSGETYRCIQAHTSLDVWTPDVTPSLWELVVVVDPTGAWQIGVDYVVDDEVTYEGVTYICLQPHTSIASWNPPAVPALWAVV